MKGWVCCWVGVFVGCASPSFDAVPELPAHEEEEDGARHAVGKEYPFLCPSTDDLRTGVECGSQVPQGDQNLSCDSASCHGGYDFRAPGAQAVGRHLRGAEGPSCYTCHDQEWKGDTKGPIRFEGRDR